MPIAAGLHVARQATPQHQNGGAGSIAAMHAGATDLEHQRGQMIEPRQIEFARAVQPTGVACSMRRQDAVGADHPQRVLITHDQMLAVPVECVYVQACHPTTGFRAQLLYEYFVAQPLRIFYIGGVARHCDDKPRLMNGPGRKHSICSKVHPIPLVIRTRAAYGRAVTVA